jgi:hypothetical protein
MQPWKRAYNEWRKETFLRLIGKRSASEVADLLERSSSDQVTLVAQALVALGSISKAPQHGGLLAALPRL